MQYPWKSAFVTGGSSGIGLAISRRLAEAGCSVWILGRDQARLDSAVEDIRAHAASKEQRFVGLSADVSDYAQVTAALSKVEDAVGTPELLVTSAGVAHPGYVEEIPIEIYHEMIEINYLGTVHAVKAVLPGMLKRGSGAIVTISSGAGFLPIFGYTAYGASKYAIRGFTDILRIELKPKGIQVAIAYPQDVDTPQLAYENKIKPFETKEISGMGKAMSADVVAREILDGAARGKYMIVSGFENRAAHRLTELIGGWTYPVFDMLVRDAIKKKAKLQSKANPTG